MRSKQDEYWEKQFGKVQSKVSAYQDMVLDAANNSHMLKFLDYGLHKDLAEAETAKEADMAIFNTLAIAYVAGKLALLYEQGKSDIDIEGVDAPEEPADKGIFDF